MFMFKVTVALICILALWSTVPDTSLNTLAVSQNETEYFAGHRVLRFYRIGKYGGKSTLLINRARVIFQDRAGIFWIGTGSGLYTYDEKQNQWMDYRDNQEPKLFRSVWIICQDRAGRIWLKSLLKEFRFFDGENWHYSERLAPPVPLPTDKSVMFTGIDGRLWFVTGAGLIAFDGQRWASPVIPPKDIAEAYAQAPKRYRNKGEEEMELWSARIDERLRQMEGHHSENGTKQVRPTDNLLSTIYRGLQDREGNIWLGARKGIVRFDPERDIWKLYPLEGIVEVRTIYEDRQDRIWFADREGHLSVYSRKLDKWTSYDLSIYFPQIQPKEITSIYQDKAGQIMIGISVDGLVLFKEEENRWRILTEENSYPPIYGVTTISEDRIGRIWIAMSDGILVLEK